MISDRKVHYVGQHTNVLLWPVDAEAVSGNLELASGIAERHEG